MVVPLLAVIVLGLALYATGSILDQVLTPDGPLRVALLPPWQALAGFFGVGVIALLWLDRRTRPRGTASAARRPLAPLVVPIFGLLLLVLPFLPVLPDLFPAIQVLAGPLRYVVWLAIAAQVVWTLWQARVVHPDWLQRFTVRQLALLVAVCTLCISGSTAARFVDSVLYPGGDEPHYLIIAQSLWRDGDLKIENNHQRGDYYEYFDNELAPHYLTRGADQEIYSIHPVGMPVLIAPVYAAGGYAAVVGFFVLMATLAATLIWYVTALLTNSPGAATFGWAAVAVTAPFLFNSFAVYPEIPAAVAVAIAFTLIAVSTSPGVLRWLVVGLACAALPWLSTKYAPMSAALVLLAPGRLVFPDGGSSSGWRGAASVASSALRSRPTLMRLAAVVGPYALSLLGWFYFFYAIWGIPLPQAPYGALVQTEIAYLIFGAPGLFFDQEYGLLPYAPVYILAATGLWTMFRSGGESRRRAIEIIVVFAALLGTVGAFRIWWGGSAPPGRPVTSGLLLLAIPMAYAFSTAPAGSARRAGQHLLLWFSIGFAGVLLFAQQGLLTANGRDGTASMLEYLSPRWSAWSVAPSFIYHEPFTAWLHSAAWLLLAAVAAVILRRIHTREPGTSSLTAMMVTAAAVLIAAAVMPRLPLTPAWPTLDVRARPRLPVLDDFDAVARPHAIEYAPFRVTPPSEVVKRASVMVEPALRTQPQPIRVLHNGRFSLPAGTYRIEIEWSGTRQGEVMGLQIGRTGDPLMTWTVDATAGETWHAEFSVPVDAPFVGLRGSAELERAIARVRFIPLAIVNASHRLREPPVIAATQSGPASLFFYDTNASPERNGFWVWGSRRTRVTLARSAAEEPAVLRVHSGPISNRLHISMFGWRQTIDLSPDTPVTVELPGDAGDVVTLEFAAEGAFVPRELNPQATDTRSLGTWVEVIR